MHLERLVCFCNSLTFRYYLGIIQTSDVMVFNLFICIRKKNQQQFLNVYQIIILSINSVRNRKFVFEKKRNALKLVYFCKFSTREDAIFMFNLEMDTEKSSKWNCYPTETMKIPFAYL